MKKWIRPIVFVVCIALICCLGIYILRTIESGGSPAWENADNMGVLEWGFKFASAIPEKPHVVDQCRAQYHIFRAYLEVGMVEKAAEAAGQINDWHECLAYGDLAIHYATEGRSGKTGLYLENAQKCLGKLIDWQNSWQRDRISLRMAKAQVIANQLGSLEKIESTLSAEYEGQFRVLRYGRMDGPDGYGDSAKKLQAMEASEHMEVRRDVAQAYIEILRQLGAEVTAEQQSFLKERIYDVSKKLPQLLAHDILCELGHAAFTAGLEKMGRQVMEDAEKQLKSRQLKARFDVNSLTALARIWDEDAGDYSRADTLLREAEALFQKDNPRGMDQARALILLAQGNAIHGNRDTAWDYFRQALQTAGSQKNARPRAMAITEICAAIGRWEKTLPEDMANEMAWLYQTLDEPW